MTCMCSLSVRGPYPTQRHRVNAKAVSLGSAGMSICYFMQQRRFFTKFMKQYATEPSLAPPQYSLIECKMSKTRGLIITISNILNASRILLLNLVCL